MPPHLVSAPKGDHRVGEFATQHREWLLTQARHICRNATDAEDLVQETLLRFIQAFDKLEALPPEKACAAWLVTTLTNLFYDQCRRQQVQARGAKDPLLSPATTEPREPSSQPVYDSITDDQFAQALETLSPKIRTTFELHAAGKKYQEIASSLGVPVGTVAKRLHDARARLRELLQRHTTSGVH